MVAHGQLRVPQIVGLGTRSAQTIHSQNRLPLFQCYRLRLTGPSSPLLIEYREMLDQMLIGRFLLFLSSLPKQYCQMRCVHC